MVLAKLQSFDPCSEIKTAVLWRKVGSDVIADYCVADEVAKETWIHLPFETYGHITLAMIEGNLR
jgi:hypothetical protein